MIKKITLFAICLLSAPFLEAQTFAEWFRQGKTQIKYLIGQIAANEILLGELTQGIQIAETGLNFIGSVDQQELSLHSDYIHSLWLVKPAIARDPGIAEIIAEDSAITRNFKSILSAKNMSPAELNYLGRVYSNLAAECSKSLDELFNILTDTAFAMSDAGRIRRIGAIARDMRDKSSFAQSFASETLLLAAARAHEQTDIRESMINNGLQ